MDFAWAINALKEGKKVTRRSLAGDPPIYLYWNKADDTIMRDYGARTASKWHPSLDNLFAEDWEEYVEPKKAAPAKSTQEALPVWPEVNADGYARMSKDSDVVVHDLVYRPRKGPVFGNTKLSFDENGQPHMGDIMTAQDSNGGKPVEEPDLDAETNKAIALVARNIAENLVELLRNPSVRRILQVNTNHEKED